MALSDEQIVQLSLEWSAETNDWASHIDFARAIEAEVRKSDEALILQLVEALENSSPHTDRSFAWKDGKWQNQRTAAIAAARARLESKL